MAERRVGGSNHRVIRDREAVGGGTIRSIRPFLAIIGIITIPGRRGRTRRHPEHKEKNKNSASYTTNRDTKTVLGEKGVRKSYRV